MTTLSILLPHYNDPKGFELSLRSIEAQTWRGTREIVVCDDGSRPKELAELERICASTAETVKLLRNEENRGRPYTRNVLLDAADGKYTAWLDAGDEWYPEKLQHQFNGLYRARLQGFTKVVWCTTNYDWQWAGAKKRIREQNVAGDQIGNMLTGSLGAYLWTVLGTTQSFRDVGHFDLKLTRLQDLDFFIRFLSKDGMLILPPTAEPLVVYHKSDIGKNGEEIARCFNYVFDKHSAHLMTRSRSFRRNRRFHVNMHAARFTDNNDQPLQTAMYLGRAAVTSPVAFVRTMVRNKGRL